MMVLEQDNIDFDESIKRLKIIIDSEQLTENSIAAINAVIHEYESWLKHDSDNLLL